MITNPRDDWARLKPDTEVAVRALLTQLESGTSPQDLIDSYLYAKDLLAESMQAYIRIEIEERCETFHKLCEQLQDEINRRYADRIPAKYLKVPYRSRVHEQLFTLLLQRRGTPVQAALLRIVTGDSVHTERRVRELRELGLDIRSSNENGHDLYSLGSLQIDVSFIPTLIGNNIKRQNSNSKKSRLPEAQLQSLLVQIGYRDKNSL